MNRRFAWLVTPLLLACVHLAQAQQPKKVQKIGLLLAGGLLPSSSDIEAFRKGLREFGYLEGQNIAIEYRVQEHGDRGDRLADLAAELVRLKVDVIVATSTGPALRAKQATKTIPIVLASVSDPVGAGLVASLARPGGNVTGLRSMTAELGGKRLELLKEVVPKLSRVAILWHSDGPGQKPQMEGWSWRPTLYALSFSPWTRGNPTATSKPYFMPPPEAVRMPLLPCPLRDSPAAEPK
jgi:putative ABC transport system substrate-binding protein